MAGGDEGFSTSYAGVVGPGCVEERLTGVGLRLAWAGSAGRRAWRPGPCVWVTSRASGCVWVASFAPGAGLAKDESAWPLAGRCGLAGTMRRARPDERATCARRQGAGARGSTRPLAGRAVGHLSWLREVLLPTGMAGSGSIWVGSGVGEGISGREKDEREEGEKERKR